MSGLEKRYEPKEIRKVLTANFDHTDLLALCQDKFPDLCNHFGRGMGKNEMIYIIIGHFLKFDDFTLLVKAISERKSGVFDEIVTAEAENQIPSEMVEPGKIIFRDYILKNRIGEGGFGRVYLVKSKIGKVFALKVLFKGAIGEKRGVESVAKIRSNRLVNVLDYGDTVNGDFCVLMEYVRNNFAYVLEKKDARHYFREILEGLKVLEKNNIVHRDIKPSNLFIHERLVKIGDFGTAKYTSGETSTKTRLLGTIKYCAPESFEDYYSFSTDRWSASVIFYRMLTGEFPFDGNTHTGIFGALIRKDPDYAIIPDKYLDFFKRCFEKKPGNRFADAQAMIHAFDETESVQKIIDEYKIRIEVLEGQLDQASEQLKRLMDKPRVQGDYINVESGRDVSFAKDRAEIEIVDSNLEIERLRKEIKRLKQRNKIKKIDKEKPQSVKEPIAEKEQPQVEALTAKTKPISESRVQKIKKNDNFIAYNDGTVLDTETGLMWASKDTGKPIDWYDAKKYCGNYRGGGYSDWRLPALQELKSLCESKTKLISIIRYSHEWIWASDEDSRSCRNAVFYPMTGASHWFDWTRNAKCLPVRRSN